MCYTGCREIGGSNCVNVCPVYGCRNAQGVPLKIDPLHLRYYLQGQRGVQKENAYTRKRDLRLPCKR